MDNWISVKDRLPKYKKNIIIHAPGYSGRPVREGFLNYTDETGHTWNASEGFIISGITHWMPLPEPPK